METKISYIKKRYAKKGILSTFLFLVAFLFLLIGIGMAFKSNGNSGLIVAALGFCAMLLSITGIAYGFSAYTEEDKDYFFARIGIVANILLFLGMIVIIIFGWR